MRRACTRHTWAGALALVIAALPTPGEAQSARECANLERKDRCRFEVGLGLGVARTNQNALGGVGTVTFYAARTAFGGIALRAFVDSEHAIQDFKEGFAYDEESDREFIVDENGNRVDPRGDELWQSRDWDAHMALYGTIRPFPRVHVGPGFWYNGLDSEAGWGLLLYAYATARTELGAELMSFDPVRWRFRITFGFWRFP